MPRLLSSSFTNHPLPSEETLASSCVRGKEPRSLEFPTPGDLGSEILAVRGAPSGPLVGRPRGHHTAVAVTQLPRGSFVSTPCCISCFALANTRTLGRSENDLSQAVGLALLALTTGTDPVTLGPAAEEAEGALEVSVPRAEAKRWLHPWVVTSPACNCSPETCECSNCIARASFGNNTHKKFTFYSLTTKR